MTFVPAVLDRSIFAAVLLFPILGFLVVVGSQDALALAVGLVIVVAALLYAGVVWAVSLRRTLREEIHEAPPAPEGATIEPLWQTAARATASALVVLGVCALPVLVDLLFLGLALATGIGLVAAIAGLTLSAWERRNPGRLVREARGIPWVPARPLQLF